MCEFRRGILSCAVAAAGVLALASCKPRAFNQGAQEESVDIATSPESCDWSLRETNVYKAWDMLAAKGMKSPGEGVSIGLLDVGIFVDPTTNWVHPELSGVNIDLKASWDFLRNEAGAYSIAEQEGNNWGHGTLTAIVIGSPRGRAAGQTYKGGISGVAPGVRILPARAARRVGLTPGWMSLVPGMGWVTKAAGLDIDESTSINLAKSIRWAVDKGVQVISISMGTSTETPGLWNATKYARDNGVILVATTGHAMGAPGKEKRFFLQPGKYGEAIGVTGSNADHKPWVMSVGGKGIDTAAPASPMCYAQLVRDQNNMPAKPTRWEIFTGEGTSFSAAQVAGIAALWVQYHGYQNLVTKYGKANIQKAFWNVLTGEGHNKPAGWDTSNFGPGVIDAAKLLSASLPEAKDLKTPP